MTADLRHLRALAADEDPQLRPDLPRPDDGLPPIGTAFREGVQVHCETCGHPVNPRRAAVCAARGHVVSVVQITVHTFNADRARPFTAQPAPYLGSTR